MVRALSCFGAVCQPVGLGILSNLIHQAMPSGKGLIGSSFMFQNDNDLKYTTRTAKAHLDAETHNGMLSVMDWSSQTSTVLKQCGRVGHTKY